MNEGVDVSAQSSAEGEAALSAGAASETTETGSPVPPKASVEAGVQNVEANPEASRQESLPRQRWRKALAAVREEIAKQEQRPYLGAKLRRLAALLVFQHLTVLATALLLWACEGDALLAEYRARFPYAARASPPVAKLTAAHFISLSAVYRLGYGSMVPATDAGRWLLMVTTVLSGPQDVVTQVAMNNVLMAAFPMVQRRLRLTSLPYFNEALAALLLAVWTVAMAAAWTASADEEAGWGFADGVWFAWQTVTTVGYGDSIASLSGPSAGSGLMVVLTLRVGHGLLSVLIVSAVSATWQQREFSRAQGAYLLRERLLKAHATLATRGQAISRSIRSGMQSLSFNMGGLFSDRRRDSAGETALVRLSSSLSTVLEGTGSLEGGAGTEAWAWDSGAAPTGARSRLPPIGSGFEVSEGAGRKLPLPDFDDWDSYRNFPTLTNCIRKGSRPSSFEVRSSTNDSGSRISFGTFMAAFNRRMSVEKLAAALGRHPRNRAPAHTASLPARSVNGPVELPRRSTTFSGVSSHDLPVRNASPLWRPQQKSPRGGGIASLFRPSSEEGGVPIERVSQRASFDVMSRAPQPGSFRRVFNSLKKAVSRVSIGSSLRLSRGTSGMDSRRNAVSEAGASSVHFIDGGGGAPAPVDFGPSSA